MPSAECQGRPLWLYSRGMNEAFFAGLSAWLTQAGLAGTPEEVVETLARYAALGSRRVYLQMLDLADLDHLRLVAADVLPHVRAIA